MSVDDRLTLEGSAAAPLDVERLERDLAAMWKSASSRAGGTAVSRACSATLIALHPPAAGPGEEDLVTAISRRQPCRVLRVDAAAPGDPPLAASAGAVCHLRPDGQGLICAEEIRISVRPEAEDRLASALRSLALGGLPVILLALGPAARRCLAFATAIADVHRVIVDSDAAPDLAEVPPPGFRDLAWARGSALRRALAVAGEDPGTASLVETLASVQVYYGGEGAAPASALLLAAWIAAAARLGAVEARPAEGGVLALRRPDGGAARLALRSEVAGAAGPITAILEAADGRRIEAGLLAKGAGARLSGPFGSRAVTLRRVDRADEVIDEIRRRDPAPGWRLALPLAREIGRRLEDTAR